MRVIQFLFIVIVPVVAAAGAVVTLFAIGALFDALENPGDLRARIEGAFRQPPAPPRRPGPNHYYPSHWPSS